MATAAGAVHCLGGPAYDHCNRSTKWILCGALEYVSCLCKTTVSINYLTAGCERLKKRSTQQQLVGPPYGRRGSLEVSLRTYCLLWPCTVGLKTRAGSICTTSLKQCCFGHLGTRVLRGKSEAESLLQGERAAFFNKPSFFCHS